MKKLTLIVTLFTHFTFAQTVIFVKENGAGDGSSWEHATDLETAMILVETHNCASVQCQIWVQSGIYYPSATVRVPANVQMFGGFAGDEEFLHQRSFAKNRTIIDGQKSFTVVHLEAGAVLDGFAIINGHSHKRIEPDTLPFGGGVWMQENTRVENCYILDNSASEWGGGIFAEGDGLVYNVLFSGNSAGLEGLAIYGTTLEVRNVTVSQNHREGDTVTVDANYCNIRVPAWVLVGTRRFETDSVWLTDTLLWSDAVTVNTCQKTTFDGGELGPPMFFHSDCRSNPGQKGDLFSWCAVKKFGDFLCPESWRVPTRDEFVNLDLILGGTGEPRMDDSLVSFINDTYLNSSVWGGFFGGEAEEEGTLRDQGLGANYWSQTESNETSANQLFFWLGEVVDELQGNVAPYAANIKSYGNSLRCVRDCPRIIINTHPDTTSRNVLEDDTFPQLFVSATSNIPLTYQWFSNTIKSNIGGTLIAGATDSNFTPPNNTPSDEVRYYYCVISNDCRKVVSEVSGAHTTVLFDANGCNNLTPGWGASLGTVSFSTNQIRVIGNQVWSDVVHATRCQKNTFDGGTWVAPANFNADCRSNSGQRGSLFSRCAVMRFRDELCPDDWRVPTRQDFMRLDIALGGTASRREGESFFINQNYITFWGGSFVGYSLPDGRLEGEGFSAYYWSQSPYGRISGLGLYFNRNNGLIDPQEWYNTNFGASLRCVRDTILPQPHPESCNSNIPGWGESLGTVSFATDSIWVVDDQVWSDAVTATACTDRTNQYRGGSSGNFNADCRSNPNYKGDLFSWCAVMRFQNQLCPDGWRVPTAMDFLLLNLALGGQNVSLGSYYQDATIRDKFLNLWGGSYSGSCYSSGILNGQGLRSEYISETECDINRVRYLNIGSNGSINFGTCGNKYTGYTLRCVRDN